MNEFGEIRILEISFGVLDSRLLLMFRLRIDQVIGEGEGLDILVKIIDEVEILLIFFVLQ